MRRDISCDEVRDMLFALVDCEECSQHEELIDSGSVSGPNMTARELMWMHVNECSSCSDAIDAERHLRALLKQCYEAQAAPPALRTRIVEHVMHQRVVTGRGTVVETRTNTVIERQF